MTRGMMLALTLLGPSCGSETRGKDEPGEESKRAPSPPPILKCASIPTNTPVKINNPASPWNGFTGRFLGCNDARDGVVAMERYLDMDETKPKPNPPWPEDYSDHVFGKGHSYYQVPVSIEFAEVKK